MLLLARPAWLAPSELDPYATAEFSLSHFTQATARRSYRVSTSCTFFVHCCSAFLQTARFLLKALLAGRSGKPVGGSASYLGALQQELASRCSARGADCWANPGKGLSEALQFTRASLVCGLSL
jgi:hypothetical protein